jgi:hypothetical protein
LPRALLAAMLVLATGAASAKDDCLWAIDGGIRPSMLADDQLALIVAEPCPRKVSLFDLSASTAVPVKTGYVSWEYNNEMRAKTDVIAHVGIDGSLIGTDIHFRFEHGDGETNLVSISVGSSRTKWPITELSAIAFAANAVDPFEPIDATRRAGDDRNNMSFDLLRLPQDTLSRVVSA